ncbi:MAG TPA: MFS transporter, partial [Candidatus Limnocylindria bacterium]|nr:MFS transporter [Candidatus Limnocylindria bacterium]
RVPTAEAVPADTGRTSTTAALRYRDFRLFWLGMVVSNVGSWMQLYGLGYLVVQLAIKDGVPHLAPFYIGVLGLARALPSLLFGLFAGAVADRTDRRRLLLVTQSAATLNALALALLTITGQVNIVAVVLIGAIGSTIFSFDAPTRQAMVPRLVGERDLVSAIGLNSVAFNGAQLAGPVLGGILYIPFGLGGLFMINALSFLAVIAALVLMRPVPIAARRRDVTMVQSIREGLGYVRRDVVVRWLMLLTATAALLTRPWIQLLPAFTEQILRVGAVELSWLMGASGAGALGGALVTASLGNLRRRGILLLVSASAMALLVAVFALQRSLVIALPLLALVGFATMLFMGMSNTLVQTRTPDHLRGRVMSVHTMVFLGVMPIGTLLLGALGTVVGVDNAIVAGALAVLALVLYAAARVAPLRDAVATPRRGASRVPPPA